jgi:predicted amidohydrolase YtcJ
MNRVWTGLVVLNSFSLLVSLAQETAPDLILHHGKIVAVDDRFSIHEAIAIRDGRIQRLGTDTDILAAKGPNTEVVDLAGKMVIPGLIDSHCHPLAASLAEFDHKIPQMDSVQDVLDYFATRAKVVSEGEWLVLRQVFITRLREQRYPTRTELDRVAPKHPVLFATGPDGMFNSLGLKANHIDRDFKVPPNGPGLVEKDPRTGEPTGLVRTFARFIKVPETGKRPNADDQKRSLLELFRDYNSVGITAVCERDVYPDQMPVYKAARESGEANIRVSLSYHVDTDGDLAAIQANIRRVAADPLFQRNDSLLRIIGIKTYLDGGMLTGSAYMQQPWGVSTMYGITDSAYRGLLFIPKDRLKAMVRTAAEAGLQFTAHSVGDGAVQTLLDTYEEVGRDLPLRATRPCIEHSNFMSQHAVEQAARLGVMVDIQPAWLYLDTRTLVKQFGYERLRYFQPFQSIFAAGGTVGGGSDHMQKIGSMRSNNPYNPFLGMATAITRRARWFDGRLHPEEALSREQALRLYTINNAHILFLDDLLGSLEPGKLADLAVLDRNLLTCSEDQIATAQVLRTYFNGKLVHENEQKNDR